MSGTADNKKTNIILIGMPGVGKSTVGVVLAKRIGYRFLDSDIVIQEQEGKLLSEIIEEAGPDGFNEVENRINASLQASRSVIATGGSAVYGKEAMAHLSEIGTIVYLYLPCPDLAERLGDLKARGVSMKEGQTLQDLFNEREPLYEKYADLKVECSGKALREIVLEIEERISYIRRDGKL